MENLMTSTKQKILFARMYRQRYLFLMLLPGTIALFVFAYIPLSGWLIAFKNYELGISLWKADWIGLSNFLSFASDASEALPVIRNTLIINISTMLINLILGCAFAILLNEITLDWFKRIVQSCSFFPFFISFVIVYSIFNAFLAVNSGVLNEFFVRIGLMSEGINFLGSEKYSWPLIIFVNCWKSLGYSSVIFLSSISSIDQEQYKSAEIDGAGRFAKIFHITLPGLASTFIVLLIMNSGWLFTSNFEQFYLFTNSTNMPTMQVFDFYIYKYGLQLLDFSYATAVGIVKTLISIMLLIIVNRISKKFSGHLIF